MKILITGGSGILGRAVANACKDVHEPIVFDRSDEAVALGGIKGDITDSNAVMAAADGCDAIIHTAALHGGDRMTASTASYIATNVVGADNVFQAAVRHGIRHVVTASTMEILIGRSGTASGMAVLDERTPPKPDWIYPMTKLQVEILGGMYANKHSINVAHLRYVAFKDQPWKNIGYNLIATYVSQEDAAAATLAAAQIDGLCNEVFLIGPDTPLDQNDINSALSGDVRGVIERHWPGAYEVLSEHYGEPDPSECWPVTRINKAKLMLGWKPRHTFDLLLHELGWRRDSSRLSKSEIPA